MYELLAGNTADNQTPMGHLAKLKKLFEQVEHVDKMIIVGDRAMLNHKLIAGYLKEKIGFLGPWTPAEVREIIAAVSEDELMNTPLQYRPRSARPDDPPLYYGVLREIDFTYEEGEEEFTKTLRLLIMYSRGKARLDRQKREDHLARASAALSDIQAKLNVRRYKRKCYVEQRIANELKKAPAARGLINWQLAGEDAALTLTFELDDEAIARAAAVDGRYALVTNTDLSADEMLVDFKRQCLVEGRFSIVKGPVPLRPIHLRSDRRIRALVFLTMVALLIYTILEWLVRQKTPGRRRPWTGRAILEVFEEWMVAIQFFADGSFIWLPPPLSDDQRSIWEALDLPDVATFLAQIFRWNMRCGT
jgi:transposase